MVNRLGQKLIDDVFVMNQMHVDSVRIQLVKTSFVVYLDDVLL